ncbi:hypothetical protein DPX16_8201 [Anabarilius grahami]|uniref:Uncharacterized protein n=1 Tax=Anabarilius grahami TaxID=495550 RepID=A0A3N0Y7Y5_ANAGA|nr:hypothetical protein DPX16_8201 [Anabarilius grahami]
MTFYLFMLVLLMSLWVCMLFLLLSNLFDVKVENVTVISASRDPRDKMSKWFSFTSDLLH